MKKENPVVKFFAIGFAFVATLLIIVIYNFDVESPAGIIKQAETLEIQVIQHNKFDEYELGFTDAVGKMNWQRFRGPALTVKVSNQNVKPTLVRLEDERILFSLEARYHLYVPEGTKIDAGALRSGKLGTEKAEMIYGGTGH